MIEVKPEEVYLARRKAKLTAESAGRLVYVTGKMWRRYERGLAPMNLAYWELFLIKTNQILDRT